MLAREAQKLGVELHVQTPDPLDPATRAASSVVLGSLDDVEATRALAERAQRISFENEWVPLAELEPLERDGIPFLPTLSSLAPLLDKRSQRQLLNHLNLPTPHWAPMEAAESPSPLLGSHGEALGGEGLLPDEATLDWWPSTIASSPAPSGPRLPNGLVFPVMAKAISGGYDGKGICLLEDQAALESHLAHHKSEDWILEEHVPFEMELAQVVCRDQLGQVRCFPLVQTHQRDQVCDWVLFPAPVSHAVEAYARNVAMSLVTSLNYVGVMGIEFFYGTRGLLVNEIAPRVHNSGHFTLEACRTNQFAQQIRIVAGLPMGLTDPRVDGALMVNLLGFGAAESSETKADYQAQRAALEAMEGARLHWYGKSPRLGRKLGHVTFVLESEGAEHRQEECAARLANVRALWPWPTAMDGHPIDAADPLKFQ
jgi:5-(carboxyamino)imidazole ribonucleotide synthase